MVNIIDLTEGRPTASSLIDRNPTNGNPASRGGGDGSVLTIMVYFTTMQWIVGGQRKHEGLSRFDVLTNGNLANSRATYGRPTNKRPSDGRPIDTRSRSPIFNPIDMRPINWSPTHRRSIDRRPTNGRSTYGSPANVRQTDWRPTNVRPINGRSSDSKFTEGSFTTSNIHNRSPTNGSRPADGVRGNQGILTTNGDVATNHRVKKARTQKDELILGIFGDAPISNITSNLSWSALYIVSSAYYYCLLVLCHSRQLQNCRYRRLHVIVEHFEVRIEEATEDLRGTSVLALYSVWDNKCYKLPGFRDDELFGDGSPDCVYAILNKRIYCLARNDWVYSTYSCMRVLDLASQQRQWQPCARSKYLRSKYTVAVLDGKIYVCGGKHNDRFTCNCEMYDPEKDTWSRIDRMVTSRYFHHTVVFEGELYAYGGFYREWNEGAEGEYEESYKLEIYNPATKEWRIIEEWGLWGIVGRERLFVAQGKLHVMSSRSIHVLDGKIEDNTWIELHTFKLPSSPWTQIDRDPVVAAGGELVTTRHVLTCNGREQYCLLRSEGFGSTTKELVWKKVNCNLNIPRSAFLGMLSEEDDERACLGDDKL